VTAAGAAAAVAALDAARSRMTEFSPRKYERRGADGTELVVTGLPLAALNRIVVEPGRDLDVVDSLAQELSTMGAPWSIQLWGEPDPGLADLAARYGRTSSSTLPLLVWDADRLPSLPTAVPPGTTVREISGSEHEVYAAALVEGSGLPNELADLLASPALLDARGMTAFLLDRNGASVATGFNVMVGEHVGLYNGSVPPKHRRNGYYRALVTARLRHAVAAGARHAFTLASPMSRPVFESLGFGVAETWTILAPES
jgi:hypothetical protein